MHSNVDTEHVVGLPPLRGGYSKYQKECVDNPEGLSHIPEGICGNTRSRSGITNLYRGNRFCHHFRTIFGHGCGPATIFSCQVGRTERSFSLTIAPLQASLERKVRRSFDGYTE